MARQPLKVHKPVAVWTLIQRENRRATDRFLRMQKKSSPAFEATGRYYVVNRSGEVIEAHVVYVRTMYNKIPYV